MDGPLIPGDPNVYSFGSTVAIFRGMYFLDFAIFHIIN